MLGIKSKLSATRGKCGKANATSTDHPQNYHKWVVNIIPKWGRFMALGCPHDCFWTIPLWGQKPSKTHEQQGLAAKGMPSIWATLEISWNFSGMFNIHNWLTSTCIKLSALLHMLHIRQTQVCWITSSRSTRSPTFWHWLRRQVCDMPPRTLPPMGLPTWQAPGGGGLDFEQLGKGRLRPLK